MCGPGRVDFFHHIGNRRFRVMIEMNIRSYISSFSNNGVGGEESLQKLIDEMLVSLSKTDPPARFLGMDMTNGTWNLLNPVFASLKTETTFFECLQVKQRRQAKLLEEELEEEWERRVQIEKEIRFAALSNTRTDDDLGSQPNQSITNRSTLSDNCPTGACVSVTAIRNCLPLVAADEGIDVPSLQTQARISLQKGKQPSTQSDPATKTTTNNMAMSDITRKFAQEQSDASRALFHREPHSKLSSPSNVQPTRDKSIEEFYVPTATRRCPSINNTSLPDTYTLTCPSKIKIFRFLPMKRFFLEENDMEPNSNAYLIPSNYVSWWSFYFLLLKYSKSKHL